MRESLRISQEAHGVVKGPMFVQVFKYLLEAKLCITTMGDVAVTGFEAQIP